MLYMKSPKSSISAALSTLASIKPATTAVQAKAATVVHSTSERIFSEPKEERMTVVLFEDDLRCVDQLIDAAKASGRRKVNQSQAIRALIRTGSFKPDVLDKVLAEDGRRKK
jgi:mRNA degradation ribonuclease J1/J2